jgi:hypothetical protein
VQKEQYRIRRVFGLDEHPLPHAIDIGKNLLGNAATRWAAILIEKR